MADEADDDNDGSFLDYFERLAPKCKTLKDLIKAEVAEAMKNPPEMAATGDRSQSPNYLERQNEMLISRLLKLEASSGSTPGEPGAPNVKPVDGPPPNGPPAPKNQGKPIPKKPFWG